MAKYPITQQGLTRLKDELRERKYNIRPRIIEDIATAREFGDLKENAEYIEARKEQSFNEGRISELEDISARSDLIDITKLDNATIKFGATVELLDDDTEQELKYHIVSEYEADISNRRISINSPIARALIGKKTGDLVEVNTPRGLKAYEVLTINYVKS